MKGQGPMEEQQQPEIKVPDLLESPLESEETAAQDEYQSMKPVQVRVIPYPPGCKSILERNGIQLDFNGEIIQVSHVMSRKKGTPRAIVIGLGIRAIVEDPQLQQTQKGAE
jgi:hypothetical protein